MSLVTDEEWTVRQLRIEFLRSEEPSAERLVRFPPWSHVRRVALLGGGSGGGAATGSGAMGSSSLPEGHDSGNDNSGAPATGGNSTGMVTASTETIGESTTSAPQAPAYGYWCPYVDDLFLERSLCYSPKVHAPATESASSSTRSLRGGATSSTAQVRQGAATTTTTTVTTTGRTKAPPPPPATKNNINNNSTVADERLLDVTTHLPLPLVFKKQPVKPITAPRPQPPQPIAAPQPVATTTSRLTALIARQREAAAANPFTRDFSHVCARADPRAITLRIYVPAAAGEDGRRPLVVVVKRESTVEEVVGYALYVFVEERRKPEFSEWSATHQQASAWNLRIVEEDGAIDEDFPALERSRKISKFAFEQFALCTVTNSPLQAGAASPSGGRTGGIILVKVHTYASLDVKQTTTVALQRDALMSDVFQTCCRKAKVNPEEFCMKRVDTITDIPMDRTLESVGVMELCLITKKVVSKGDAILHPLSMDKIIFLKVHMYSTLHVKQTTTVALHMDTLMSKVFEECCKKGKIERPEEFTLRMVDTVTEVSMDQTLAATGLTEVCLLKKSSGESRGDMFLQPPPEITTSGDDDTTSGATPGFLTEELASTYRKYNVARKTAMFTSRQERHLVIDGSDIYIMPAENQTNSYEKTISFHVAALLSCVAVKKGTTAFKLSYQKDKEVKMYEFDAATVQEAVEICAKLTFLSQVNRNRE